jgi:hypothetical protein
MLALAYPALKFPTTQNASTRHRQAHSTQKVRQPNYAPLKFPTTQNASTPHRHRTQRKKFGSRTLLKMTTWDFQNKPRATNVPRESKTGKPDTPCARPSRIA